MPEGPEVLFMIDELQKYINNDLISFKIISGRYTRHKKPIHYHKFNKLLPLKINKISCKGKFIYIIFENDWCIWITLGMTGHIVYEKTRYTHYIFNTSIDTFYLEDMRNFGTIHFYKLDDRKFNLNKKLDSLGFDIIQDKINFKIFKNHFKNFIKKTPNKMIGILLLDQSFLAGIGNYLRSEILYSANLSPKLLLKDFTEKQQKELYKYSFKIPKDSYNYQKKYLMMHSYPFKIYKKKFTPKGEKVKKYKLGNRTIYTIY